MIQVKHPELLTRPEKRFLTNITDKGDDDVSDITFDKPSIWTRIKNFF